MSYATTSPASAICPGQQSLFNRNEHARQHAPHLRAVFMVYWSEAAPSAEVFYLDGFPLQLTPTGIANLQITALQEINRHNDNRALSATYLGYEGVQMSPNDLTEADWRVIGAPAIPLPGPTPPDSPASGTEPAPHVMQPKPSTTPGAQPGAV